MNIPPVEIDYGSHKERRETSQKHEAGVRPVTATEREIGETRAPPNFCNVCFKLPYTI